MNLCWLFCCPPLPRFIINKVAFMPPAPTYSFEETADGLRFVSRVFLPSRHEQVTPFFVTTAKGGRVACLHLRCGGGGREAARWTLLASHGNSEDLGLAAGGYLQLARRLRCDVVGYDYSGYGASTGRPSERNMYADVLAVWAALRHLPPEKVVLYGYSLGTAPTVHLAARPGVAVAGVVLQAPMTSALRVAFPGVRRTWCCDAFNNVDKIGRVRAPVLVIHGTEDDVIDLRHGVEMFSRCVDPAEPLWLEGANHHDVHWFDEYWERLDMFLAELEARVAQGDP